MELNYAEIPRRPHGGIARLIEWMNGDVAEPVGRACEWALVIAAIVAVVSFLSVGHDGGITRETTATAANCTRSAG